MHYKIYKGRTAEIYNADTVSMIASLSLELRAGLPTIHLLTSSSFFDTCCMGAARIEEPLPAK